MATQTTGNRTLHTVSLTGIHWLGIALAAVTGIIHLWLWVSFIDSALGWAFFVAAVGFFAGIGAVLIDYRRRSMYLLGVPFTAGQIVAWYILNRPDFGTMGFVDKAVQILLIAVLVVLYRRADEAT